MRVQKSPSMFRPDRRTAWYVAAILLTSLIVIPQLHQFSGSMTTLRDAELAWLLLGVVAMSTTVAAAAAVYVILVPQSLNYPRTALIQTATHLTNRFIPAGLGGIGVNALYLVKQVGLSRTEAGVYATANNIVGFVAFSLTLLLISFATNHSVDLPALPISRILLALGALTALVIVAALLRRSFQKRLVDFVGHLLGVLLTIIQHPWRLLLALLCSCLITLGYLTVFWAALKSVGIELEPLQLSVAFLAGNAALSVSPTPGGLGAVEAALTASLISMDVPAPHALSAILLYRFISYWLPIVPGALALRRAVHHDYI